MGKHDQNGNKKRSMVLNFRVEDYENGYEKLGLEEVNFPDSAGPETIYPVRITLKGRFDMNMKGEDSNILTFTYERAIPNLLRQRQRASARADPDVIVLETFDLDASSQPTSEEINA